MRYVLTILGKALVITAGAAAIAVTTNATRPDGIPLVTDVPYDIFSECRDAEAETEAVSEDELAASDAGAVLFIDARPAEQFAKAHAEGALNVPYSALFGAKPEDIEHINARVAEQQVDTVVVYGAYTDPANPGTTIDFGKPLADQLKAAGIKGVKHIGGGLEALKKLGLETVKTPGVN